MYVLKTFIDGVWKTEDKSIMIMLDPDDSYSFHILNGESCYCFPSKQVALKCAVAAVEYKNEL